MFVQRIQSLNIRIDQQADTQPSTGTNWNNVQNKLFNMLGNRPPANDRRYQQRRNIINTLARDFDIPSDEDSFANQSNILSSTPVMSTPKHGQFRMPQIQPPRISVIPKRTPLRSNAALMNIPSEFLEERNTTIVKRKSGASQNEQQSAKKFKASQLCEEIVDAPYFTPAQPLPPPRRTINPMNYYESFNIFESPYNSPYTPNTIKNLDQQRTMYNTYASRMMTANQSGFPFRHSMASMTQTLPPVEDVFVRDATVQTSRSPGTELPVIDQSSNRSVQVARKSCPSTSANESLIKQNLFPNTHEFDAANLSISSQVIPMAISERKPPKRSTSFKGSNKSRSSIVSTPNVNKKENNCQQEEEEEEEEEVNPLEGNDFSVKEVSKTVNRSLKQNGKMIVNYSSSIDRSHNHFDDGEDEQSFVPASEIISSESDSDQPDSDKSSSKDDDDHSEVDKDAIDDAQSVGSAADGDDEESNEPSSEDERVPQLVADYSDSHVELPSTNSSIQVEKNSSLQSGKHLSVVSPPNSTVNLSRNTSTCSKNHSRKEISKKVDRSLKQNGKVIVNYSSSIDQSHNPFDASAVEAYIAPEVISNDSGDDLAIFQPELESIDYKFKNDNHADNDLHSASADELMSEEDPFSNNGYQSHDAHQEEGDEQSESESEPEMPAPEMRKKISRESMKRRIFANLHEYDEIIRPHDNSVARICRRSKRNRVRPLNFWAGQRPLYQWVSDKRGNAVSTLVGVSRETFEPVRRRIARKKTVVKLKLVNGNDKENKNSEFKMDNILDLSIHNAKAIKKLKNLDSEAKADEENVLALEKIDFKESKLSPGIFTAITKKVGKVAFGKIKFAPKAEKKKTKTADYVTHFNVVYGTLLLTMDSNEKASPTAPKVDTVIKSGGYFCVSENTNYSIINLRKDSAIIDFTILKN